MIGASFRKYDSFQDFVVDVIFTVMDKGNATIFVNYKDYAGLVSCLNEKVLNGNTLCLDPSSADLFEEDIASAQMNDGVIMVTVFASGVITGEAVVFKESDSFMSDNYFVEYDARQALQYPLEGLVVPFVIRKDMIDY